MPSADTKRVLTPVARTAFDVILLIAVIVIGYRTLMGEAHAVTNPTLEAKVDSLVSDMQAVKCRLNIDNRCPTEAPPVRTSGVPR
jgi:hypothetical protein